MFRSLSAQQEQSFTRSCTITSILEVLKLVLARSNGKSIIHMKSNVSRGFLWAKLKIFVEPSPSVPPWLVWYLLKNSIFYMLCTPIPKQLKWDILVTTQRRIEDLKNIYDWVFCENSEKLLTAFSRKLHHRCFKWAFLTFINNYRLGVWNMFENSVNARTVTWIKR